MDAAERSRRLQKLSEEGAEVHRRGMEAFARGDKTAGVVAYIEHCMIIAAHTALRENPV